MVACSLQSPNRFCHDDQPVGVGGVGPTRDQGETLIVGGGDPLGIGTAHCFGLALFLKKVLLRYNVAISHIPHVEEYLVAWFQVNQIPKDLALDVVVS
jgi:hypothetical protein